LDSQLRRSDDADAEGGAATAGAATAGAAGLEKAFRQLLQLAQLREVAASFFTVNPMSCCGVRWSSCSPSISTC